MLWDKRVKQVRNFVASFSNKLKTTFDFEWGSFSGLIEDGSIWCLGVFQQIPKTTPPGKEIISALFIEAGRWCNDQ
jgi:hypothetical protein